MMRSRIGAFIENGWLDDGDHPAVNPLLPQMSSAISVSDWPAKAAFEGASFWLLGARLYFADSTPGADLTSMRTAIATNAASRPITPIEVAWRPLTIRRP